MANEYGTGTLADSAEQVRDQATKYGQKAMDAMESGRKTAVSALENAAAGISAKVDELPGAGAVSGFARQTADKLNTTAEYLRDHDMNDMAGEVKRFVKAHPMEAIVGAVVVGFLAGRAARS